MKNIHKQYVWSWLIVSALTIHMSWAQPNDNPYRTMYNPANSHWTDSLKWNNISVATDMNITPDDNLDDSTAIAQAILTIHQAGGGVLYFPPGVYNVNGNIIMKSGVVLRGANPTGITDAKVLGYNPASKLIFPKYILDTTANGGQGYDNSTGFKGIVGEYECSNVGVVNFDVNRAYISFQPDYNTSPGAPYTHAQPIQQNRNVIVFGVRSNNAAVPDPGIPRPDSPQKPWQRYMWRFTANIDITVMANGVVANCRANGEPDLDETYNQPGYVYNQRNTTNWPAHPTGDQVRFDFNEHYGISVNRKKKDKLPNGTLTVHGYATFATPEIEPTLFCPGIEIRDNYVFNNSRVSIMGSGNGLIIDGNVSRMDPSKEDETKYIVAPTGWRTLQGATTLENRAIDFSGWNCTISNNDFTVSRSKVGGYLTTDGEGILVQECCGGTAVNDYRILNNVANGRYIGLYKMRTMNNVEVRGNNMGNGPLWMWANTNGETYFLNNLVIKQNTNVSGINVTGSRGGVNCVVDSNTSSGVDKGITVPCYVKVGNNNTGFKAPTYNTNGGEPCLPTANYPIIAIVEPASDLEFCTPPADSITLRFKLLSGIPDSNRLTVYRGSDVIATGIMLGADSTASIKVATPANALYRHNYTVKTDQKAIYSELIIGEVTEYELVLGAVDALSSIRSIERACALSTADELWNEETLAIYPNPGTGLYRIAGISDDAVVNVYNYMGKKVVSASGTGFDITGQPAGMYYAEIIAVNKKVILRVIKD